MDFQKIDFFIINAKLCAKCALELTIFYPTDIPKPREREKNLDSFQYPLRVVVGAGSKPRPVFPYFDSEGLP
jgi:hypothetical protein